MSRVIDKPQPGYYRVRMVRKGPWVPALIYLPCPCVPVEHDIHPDEWLRPLDRSCFLAAEIDGADAEVERVWIGGRPIPLTEWQYLTDSAAWDRENAPDSPAANPRHSINLAALPPAF